MFLVDWSLFFLRLYFKSTEEHRTNFTVKAPCSILEWMPGMEYRRPRKNSEIQNQNGSSTTTHSFLSKPGTYINHNATGLPTALSEMLMCFASGGQPSLEPLDLKRLEEQVTAVWYNHFFLTLHLQNLFIVNLVFSFN